MEQENTQNKIPKHIAHYLRLPISTHKPKRGQIVKKFWHTLNKYSPMTIPMVAKKLAWLNDYELEKFYQECLQKDSFIAWWWYKINERQRQVDIKKAL